MPTLLASESFATTAISLAATMTIVPTTRNDQEAEMNDSKAIGAAARTIRDIQKNG